MKGFDVNNCDEQLADSCRVALGKSGGRCGRLLQSGPGKLVAFCNRILSASNTNRRNLDM
jgi:hypothetical protein